MIAETTTGSGIWSFKEVQRNVANTDWVDVPDGLTDELIGEKIRPVLNEGITGSTASVGDVVELVRTLQTDGSGKPELVPMFLGRQSSRTVKGQLINRDGTDPAVYGWKQIDEDDTGAVTDTPGGIVGTPTDQPAVEINSNPFNFASASGGDIVELTEGFDPITGKRLWFFTMDWTAILRGEKTGGVAGDEFVDCTFTYKIRTEDGEVLQDTLSPRRARLPKTTYTVPGGTSLTAVVKWDGRDTKTITLASIEEERPIPVVCNP